MSAEQGIQDCAGLRVCVTGGAGFIGSHVVRRLVREGARVTVLDDFSTGREANLADLGSAIDIRRGTVLSLKDLQEAFEECEAVYHLAAYISAPGSVQEPGVCREINETGTFNVLEVARETGVRRVIFTSSSAVYGDSQSLPKRELDPYHPTSPYGLSKAAGELMMQTWAECYGLETVSLRLFNVYGPRQQADSAYAAVIAAFLAAAVEGREFVVYGDGAQTRDFIYVEDVAQGFLRASLAPGPFRGEAFNIGRGEEVSVNELTEAVARIAGRGQAKRVHRPARPGDVLHSRAEIELARESLGFQPVVPLEEGLAKTFAWYAAAASGAGL